MGILDKLLPPDHRPPATPGGPNGPAAPAAECYEPDGLPAQAARGRDAQRLLQTEMLAEWRAFMQSMTRFAERFAGRVVNHVLEVRLSTLPTPTAGAAFVKTDWHVAAGSVYVRNLGTHPMTVSPYGPDPSGAPTSGIGVWVIPAGVAETVPIASRQLTVYGTAGDQVEWAAFTTEAAPVA